MPFNPEERDARAYIGRWKAEQADSTPRIGVAAPDAPIPWKTPPKKKKSLLGLISRLKDPKPLSETEESQLKIALSSDRIVTGDRTDEGALMNLRSQYQNY